MKQPSDKELVEAVTSGDTSAYGNLYDRYAPLVRSVCFDFSGNIADAQDLSQDVFIRAFKKLSELREPELFGRWLISIARLRCKEWYRQQAKEKQKYSQLNNDEPTDEASSNDGRIEKLREMIRRLPEKERLILHTFYLQGKSVDKGCELFGLSRSGFYKILERARKQLAILMTEERQVEK